LGGDFAAGDFERALGDEIDDAAEAALAEQDGGGAAHDLNLLEGEWLGADVVVEAEEVAHAVEELAEGAAADGGPVAAGVKAVLFCADAGGVAEGFLHVDRGAGGELLARDYGYGLRCFEEGDGGLADGAADFAGAGDNIEGLADALHFERDAHGGFGGGDGARGEAAGGDLEFEWKREGRGPGEAALVIGNGPAELAALAKGAHLGPGDGETGAVLDESGGLDGRLRGRDETGSAQQKQSGANEMQRAARETARGGK
jgi:hypothetical protein